MSWLIPLLSLISLFQLRWQLDHLSTHVSFVVIPCREFHCCCSTHRKHNTSSACVCHHGQRSPTAWEEDAWPTLWMLLPGAGQGALPPDWWMVNIILAEPSADRQGWGTVQATQHLLFRHERHNTVQSYSWCIVWIVRLKAAELTPPGIKEILIL